MGTCAAIASPKGAFLNGSSSPVRLRVPSGKTTTEVPPRILRAASSYAANALLRAERSMGTCPTASIARPRRGIRNNSRFATKRTEPGSVANSAQMSNIEEWFEAYMTGRSRGMFSNPSATTGVPAALRISRDQSLLAQSYTPPGRLRTRNSAAPMAPIA